MDKSRAETSPITGTTQFWTGNTAPTPTWYSKLVPLWEQRTRTVQTSFPMIRNFLARYKEEYAIRPEFMEWLRTQDFGSSFRTEVNSVSSSLSDVAFAAQWGGLFNYNFNHQGQVLLTNSTPYGFTTQTEWDQLNQELFGLGGTAFARTQPMRPQVNLAVTFGELKKDGLPTILGSLMQRSRTLKDVFRNSGSEYLNVQFGWAPLLRDVQAIAQTAARSRRLLEQNERDVSRLIRRRYQFEPKVEHSVGLTQSLSNYTFMPLTPLSGVTTSNVRSYSTSDRIVEVNKVTTKSWFSGGFRYYFYSYGEGLEYFTEIERKANTLLGTRLDPEVLWNLQPWTWMTDWFLNTGDVMSNLSSMLADHVVMQYGYLMQQKEVDREINMPPVQARTNTGWVDITHGYRVTHHRVRKARVKASPFGFGLNPSDFTSDQMAILGALGISKLT